MMDLKKILRTVHHEWSRYRAADLEGLALGLVDRQSSVDEEHHGKTLKKIVDAYHQAQAVPESSLPLPYHVGGAWRDDISTRRKEYLDAFESGDSATLGRLFANFFRNSGVAGTWSHNYYPNIVNGGRGVKKGFVSAILEDYQVWKDLVEDRDISAVSAPTVGNPWGYLMDGSLIMADSFRLHYHANKVQNLLSDINRPVVVEIGGGYGGFAYYLLNRREPCAYIGYDLPIVLAIQTYYLMNAFPEKKFLLFDSIETEISGEIIEKYDVILMPHFHLPRLANDTVDLFINANSLSEMDYPTINEYLTNIGRTCKHFFFHENSDKTVLNVGHQEVPASRYPIPANFKQLYKHYSPWGGGAGRQREYLYERRQD